MIKYKEYEKSGLFSLAEFKKLRDKLKETKNKSDKNIFKILKLQNYEIRHSNYLAWLLNPKKQHCFLNSKGIKDEALFLKDLLNIDIKNLSNINVHPEYPVPKGNYDKKGRIDILIESKIDNFVCVIENKYGSVEHDEQCKRYKEFIKDNEEFNDREKQFIYLDIFKPDEKLFSEGQALEGYKLITYDQILDKLKNIQIDDVFHNEVLNQYKSVIEENYIFDDKSSDLCKSILKNEDAIKILLQELEYDESYADDCNTVYKIQTYMWDVALKKANQFVENLFYTLSKKYRLKLLETNGKYSSGNYGVYRCIPEDCAFNKLKLDNSEYSPIMYIAISNNINVYPPYGINISIEVANSKDEKRDKLIDIIKRLTDKVKGKNWSRVELETLISKEAFFKQVFCKKNNDVNTLLKQKESEISNIIDIYKKIVKEFNKSDLK